MTKIVMIIAAGVAIALVMATRTWAHADYQLEQAVSGTEAGTRTQYQRALLGAQLANVYGWIGDDIHAGRLLNQARQAFPPSRRESCAASSYASWRRSGQA